jgi:uncharacterized membrane protein
MSDTTVIPKRSRWWQALLIGSLALNLLVGGAVVTRMVTHGGADRLTGASYTQLIPRRFFTELPRERRRVLLDILKKYRDDFRGDREASGQVAVKLADAIVVEPYDVEKVKLVVNEFASQNGKLAARGGDAALDILSVLTPEERQFLATAIRDRAGKKKK